MIGYNLPVSPQAWTVVIFGQSVAKTNQPLSPRKQISLFRLPKWFSMLLFWNIINNHDQSPKKNIELLVKWSQQCKFWTFKKKFSSIWFWVPRKLQNPGKFGNLIRLDWSSHFRNCFWQQQQKILHQLPLSLVQDREEGKKSQKKFSAGRLLKSNFFFFFFFGGGGSL